MLHSSKVLTVSYGTFSCTLEGFDDPVETMKVVAEYFRELSNRDRYFGSEPPTPDPAVLNRLASETIRRPVETEEHEDGVILRPAAPAPAAPAVDAPAEPAESSAPGTTAESEEEAAPIIFLSHRHAATEAAMAESAETGREETANLSRAATESAATAAGEELRKAETPARLRKTDAVSAIAPQAEDETTPSGGNAEEKAPPLATEAAPGGFEAGRDVTPSKETASAAALEGAAAHEAIPARVAARIRRIREALELREPAAATGGETAETDAAGTKGPHSAEATVAEDGAGSPEVIAEKEPAEEAKTPQAVETPPAKGEKEAAAPADGEPETAPAAEQAVTEQLIAHHPSADRPASAGKARDDATGDGGTPTFEEALTTELEREARTSTSDNVLILTREMVRGQERPREQTRTEERAKVADEATASTAKGREQDGHREEAEVLAESLGEKTGGSTSADRAEDAAPALSPRMQRRIRKRIAREELALQRLLEAADKRMNQAEIARKRDEIRHLKAAIAATRSDESLAPEHRSRKGAEKVSEFRRHLAEIDPGKRDAGARKSRRPPLVLVEPIATGTPGKAGAAASEPSTPAEWELALSESPSFDRFITAIEVTSVEALIEAAAAWITYGEGRTRFTRLEISELIAPVCEDFGIQREEVLRAFGQLLREGALTRIAPGDFAMTKRSHFVRGMPMSA